MSNIEKRHVPKMAVYGKRHSPLMATYDKRASYNSKANMKKLVNWKKKSIKMIIKINFRFHKESEIQE